MLYIVYDNELIDYLARIERVYAGDECHSALSWDCLVTKYRSLTGTKPSLSLSLVTTGHFCSPTT